MDRNEDLMRVFERRWKANHNDDLAKAKQNNQEFNDKMFGKLDKAKLMTNEEKLRNMQNNINAIRRNNFRNFK